MFLPIGVAVYYSLTNYRGAGGYDFVGMANYSRLVGDKLFWLSLGNTLKITITTLIILIPLSFLLAWVLKEEKRGNNIFKTIFFTSYCVGGIIVGLVWTFILDPSKGLVNNFFAFCWNGGTSARLDWRPDLNALYGWNYYHLERPGILHPALD
ncbi:MAG: carbohydrate ABC transporter permease [[Clostridium] leptum]